MIEIIVTAIVAALASTWYMSRRISQSRQDAVLFTIATIATTYLYTRGEPALISLMEDVEEIQRSEKAAIWETYFALKEGKHDGFSGFTG